MTSQHPSLAAAQEDSMDESYKQSYETIPTHCVATGCSGVGAVVGALVLLAMGDLVLLGDLVATGALLLLGALLDFEAGVLLKLRAMALLLLTAAALNMVTHNARIAAVAMRMIFLLPLLTTLPAWLEEWYSSASWPKGSAVTSSRPSLFEVFVATISISGALKSLALKVMMFGRRVGGFCV